MNRMLLSSNKNLTFSPDLVFNLLPTKCNIVLFPCTLLEADTLTGRILFESESRLVIPAHFYNVLSGRLERVPSLYESQVISLHTKG